MDKPKEGDWIVSSGSGRVHSVRAAFLEEEKPLYQIEVDGLVHSIYDEDFEPGPQGQASTYRVLARPPYDALYIRESGAITKLRALAEDEPIPRVGEVVGFDLNGAPTVAVVVEVVPPKVGFFGQVRMVAPGQSKE